MTEQRTLYIVRRPPFPGLLAALFAVFLASATIAQQNLDFYGRWMPASSTAGDWPLFVERARIYNRNDDGEIIDEGYYQVIKDFDSHVLIHSWLVWSNTIKEGAGTDPDLLILSIKDWSAEGYPPERHLNIEYCGDLAINKFFFEGEDGDKIWDRIMAWSNKKGDFSKFLSRFPNASELLDRFPNRCLFDPVVKTFRGDPGGRMRFRKKLKDN